jgi:hypothetical protein
MRKVFTSLSYIPEALNKGTVLDPEHQDVNSDDSGDSMDQTQREQQWYFLQTFEPISSDDGSDFDDGSPNRNESQRQSLAQ